MRVQRQSNGQMITLNTELGGGGEGKIYSISEEPLLVAKVYHQSAKVYADKLSVMFANPPDDSTLVQGRVSIAWPVDLLKDTSSQEIIGFLMRRVTEVRPVHDFYIPATRRDKSPYFNYLYLHRTARNLAAAVSALHAKGYVIGDVNESNILVTETALVTLVDTDSFQVLDLPHNKIYRCPVGKPEFTPPELQGKTFRDIDRTPEHDLFGLAVVIFQLLMEGTHPFDGVFQGSGDPPPKEKRILEGHFPYGNRIVPYRSKPLAPPFDILHPTLRQLFIRCFDDGHNDPKARPDAKSWVKALVEAENTLVTCSVNDQHRYGNYLSVCPWCERTVRLGGRDPFPVTTKVKSATFTPTGLQDAKTQMQSNQASTIPQFSALTVRQIILTIVASFSLLLRITKTSNKWHTRVVRATSALLLLWIVVSCQKAIQKHQQYAKLNSFLASGDWRSADQETRSLMLKISNKELEDEIGGLPDNPSINMYGMASRHCEDLQIINQLWMKYSNGKFGLSVQKSIWKSVGGRTSLPDKNALISMDDPKRFFKSIEIDDEFNRAVRSSYRIFESRVGWESKKSRIYDIDKAPIGHLPSNLAFYIAMESNWWSLFTVPACKL
ncbi:MAG TPA: GUN4 domain-containing protein [Leptolyngbyaceae cyanobacterium]